MRVAQAIVISDEERRDAQALVARPQRAGAVGAASQDRAPGRAGKLNQQIAAELGTGMKTVCLWRNRFAKSGLAGIEKDAPRGGRPATARAEVAAEIIRKTTTEKPPAATHWSTRTLAAELGTSPAMVQRVWKANRLQPHRTKTFKLSNDPQFAEKLVDVVGLYLNPPEHALVLCVDEKSQIQALDRTQKGLPIHPGRLGTQQPVEVFNGLRHRTDAMPKWRRKSLFCASVRSLASHWARLKNATTAFLNGLSALDLTAGIG